VSKNVADGDVSGIEDLDLESLTEGMPEDHDKVEPDESAGKNLFGRVRKRRSDAGKPRGPRSGGTRRVTKARVTALAGKLSSGFNLVAAGLVSVDQYSALVVSQNAEKLGNAWAPVIAQNPRLVQVLDHLEKGGNLGAALLATGAVALPILVHHRPDWFPEHIRAVGRAMGPQIPAQDGSGVNGAHVG